MNFKKNQRVTVTGKGQGVITGFTTKNGERCALVKFDKNGLQLAIPLKDIEV